MVFVPGFSSEFSKFWLKWLKALNFFGDLAVFRDTFPGVQRRFLVFPSFQQAFGFF